MIEGFDEIELLELVENELDPERAEGLETRLRAAPRVQALVERLRQDRATLRSVGTPAPPIDFLAAIEPMITRSMLIAPPTAARPGAYRRRHGRSARPRRLIVRAVAAVVVVAAFAAVWAAVNLTWPMGATDPTRSAIRDEAVPLPPSVVAEPTEASAVPVLAPPAGLELPAGAIVHHWGPITLADQGTPRPTPGAGIDAHAERPLVAAAFTLVMPPMDEADAARLLCRVSASPRTDAAAVAVVRNFTWAEAQGMVARLYAKGASRERPPNAVSGLDADARSTDEPRARRQRLAGMLRTLRARDLPAEDDRRLSRQLAGPDHLAPSYEQQLAFASDGAAFTITVPAARLPELMTRLRVDADLAITLRPLPAAGDDTPATLPPLQRWLRDHRVVRDFLSQMRHDHPDGFIMVPVVVEEGSDGGG